MHFVTGLPVSINWKRNSYNSILVIFNRLTKMVHYKPVKITLHLPRLKEVIIGVVICQHGFLDSIVTNRSSFFTSKFCSLRCYFFGIKWRLSTAFYPPTDGQTEEKNSIIKVYLRAFVNFEQID